MCFHECAFPTYHDRGLHVYGCLWWRQLLDVCMPARPYMSYAFACHTAYFKLKTYPRLEANIYLQQLQMHIGAQHPGSRRCVLQGALYKASWC